MAYLSCAIVFMILCAMGQCPSCLIAVAWQLYAAAMRLATRQVPDLSKIAACPNSFDVHHARITHCHSLARIILQLFYSLPPNAGKVYLIVTAGELGSILDSGPLL